MREYIDAEKLRNFLSEIKKVCPINDDERHGRHCVIIEIEEFIDSLQQEQPEVPNGKFVFPKYLYARTKDNKTIDMSYAPQNLAAVEYVRNDFIEQEQPEVDLDALVNEAFDKYGSVDGYGQLSVSFNRAELYSFIKKIAKKEE